MTRASIDRRFLAQTLVLWLLFSWPLLLFGHPAYFADTKSYFKGGAVAVGFVLDRLSPEGASPPPEAQDSAAVTQAPATEVKEVREAKGIRSIPYSVASYVLAGPGNRMVPLAAMQGLFLAIALAAAFASADVQRPRQFWTIALALAFASPAAWFAAYAMPDLLGALTILILGVLTAQTKRLSLALLCVLVAIAAFAVSAHASHILLAMAMLMIAAGASFVAEVPHRTRALGWLSGAVALSVTLVLATSVIGFGELSLAPKRYPFLIARAVEMPSTRAYLENICEQPNFEVCRLFPEGMPTSSHLFLWGKNGVDAVATPDQIERLRGEELALMAGAFSAAPFATVRDVIGGIFSQMVQFRLTLDYGLDVRLKSPTEIELAPSASGGNGARSLFEALTAASVLVALIAIMLWYRRRNPHWLLATMLIGGVIANAAICATLSTVADRYQARVIWLLPLAAFFLWLGRIRQRGDMPSGAESRSRVSAMEDIATAKIATARSDAR